MPETRADTAAEQAMRRFPDVDAVLDDGRLSTEEKTMILEQWEYDARLIEVAEEENMASDDPSPLTRIRAALTRLGVSSTDAPAAPTKAGGGRSDATPKRPA